MLRERLWRLILAGLKLDLRISQSRGFPLSVRRDADREGQGRDALPKSSSRGQVGKVGSVTHAVDPADGECAGIAPLVVAHHGCGIVRQIDPALRQPDQWSGRRQEGLRGQGLDP